MVVSIPQLIAAINPNLYHDTGESPGSAEHAKKLREFKNLIKEKGIYKAAEKSKPRPSSEHKLIYDSPTETLEPIYFFILDLMNDFGLNVEKLSDNFVSSPGSQHFGEMGQRISIMQQQGSKLMGDINTVLRSILNLIYDLREFKIRLEGYEDYRNPAKKQQAILSLKQIWMDKVDIQKGNSSIKSMALGQAGFNTLIDAFLAVNEDKDIEDLDLNDIIKRILRPRLYEFNKWVEESEAELRKRFEVEKTYLKSQVESLKLYSRWAKPYMKAAQELEMSESGRNPALVKMFNSLVLELTLLGKRKIDSPYKEIKKSYKPKRDYFLCVLVDFVFRGIPNRTQQGYVVGGRAEVTFRSYALNSEEIKKLNDELDNSDLSDALRLIEGATTDSLETLDKDIKDFIEDKKDEEKEKKKTKDTSNPFLALLGFYNEKEEKKEEKKETKEIKSDDWIEKNYTRPEAAKEAQITNYSVFDIYKKAHGMGSLPFSPYDIYTFASV